MKKKRLLIILLMSIGFLIPTGVFANEYIYNRNILYKVYVNYQFDGEDGAIYKLYDDSGMFYFESTYDDQTDKHVFNSSSNNEFLNYDLNFYNQLNNATEWDKNFFNNLITNTSKFKVIDDHTQDCCGGTFWSSTGIVPMILEKKNNTDSSARKIVFATINNSFKVLGYYCYNYPCNRYIRYRYNFSLVNIDNSNCETNCNSANIEFMKNSKYEYSDELWEELNSSTIASSEVENFVEEFYRTNDNKAIYSKYKSNVNYRFKATNGNGMKFILHDMSNTFSFNSQYDKNTDTYSIVDNSNDSDYQEGIKEFSKIIIDEVKNGNFNGLADKYNSITSDNCNSTNCSIYTYIPMILEGNNNSSYAKKIVLGLLKVDYRQDSGNDYYDVSLDVYNNTCELLNSNIGASMSDLINLTRSITEDYSSSLIREYSDGSIAIEDIYNSNDVNNLKDEYCNDIPVIKLRKNPLTFNNGVLVLIVSIIIVLGSCVFIINRKNN